MKTWYKSKIVWAMVVQSLISILLAAQEWYAKGDFSIPAIIGLAIAVLVIILRVWFTDKPVETPAALQKWERVDPENDPKLWIRKSS